MSGGTSKSSPGALASSSYGTSGRCFASSRAVRTTRWTFCGMIPSSATVCSYSARRLFAASPISALVSVRTLPLVLDVLVRDLFLRSSSSKSTASPAIRRCTTSARTALTVPRSSSMRATFVATRVRNSRSSS